MKKSWKNMTKIFISSDFNDQFFGYESDDFKKKKCTHKKNKIFDEKMSNFFVNFLSTFFYFLISDFFFLRWKFFIEIRRTKKFWPHFSLFSHFKSTISQKLKIGKSFFLVFHSSQYITHHLGLRIIKSPLRLIK